MANFRYKQIAHEKFKKVRNEVVKKIKNSKKAYFEKIFVKQQSQILKKFGME